VSARVCVCVHMIFALFLEYYFVFISGLISNVGTVIAYFCLCWYTETYLFVTSNQFINFPMLKNGKGISVFSMSVEVKTDPGL